MTYNEAYKIYADAVSASVKARESYDCARLALNLREAAEQEAWDQLLKLERENKDNE